MELDQKIESQIKEKAFEYMKQSRPGWNVPHLHAAIFYMKELLAHEGGDPRILLPAIYLHDIGYAGMLNEDYSYDENKKVKKDHMIIGARVAKQLLIDIGEFSEDEIGKISELISIHDNLSEIKGQDAQLVFEADSLAQIDIDNVTPTFDKNSYSKFIDHFKNERVPIFKTKTGLKYLRQLFPKAEKYFS